MNKTYYILAIDYGYGFGVEFGAYDKADVIDEKDFQKNQHECWPIHKQFKTKVIKTIEDQNAINKEINKLNEEQ
jgi:hypothetical protein